MRDTTVKESNARATIGLMHNNYIYKWNVHTA